MIGRPFVSIRPADTTDSPPFDDDADMLSIRLYHGGKLRWLPRTEYVGGELSIYDFHGIGKLSIDDIVDKVHVLGYSGLKYLYFRVPTASLETGLVPLNNVGDFNLMLSYAQENNYRVDIFVKHFNEEEDDDHELTTKDYENICPDDYERRDSNHILDMDEDDEEWPPWSDSDYDMSDDDAIFEQNVDEGAEWIGKIRHNLGLSDAEDSEEEENDVLADDGEASDCDSLDSLFEDMYGDSIPGMSKIKWPTYKESVPSKLEVGMTFENHLKFRDAITRHSYEEGRMVSFLLSDRKRVKAVCKLPCKWYIYASLNFDKSFQIKQVGPDHTCVREQRGLPLIHSGFLSRKYLNDFRMNPSWPIDAFHKKVLQDLQLDFKPHVLRRAKRKCLKAINGSDADQYAKLWDYKQELLARNPDSTVEMEFEEGKPGVFKRIYICFGGLKHGFKLGCRKVIGLDGTHIKTTYKGQILTAVGVDPNNCMYPIAYAVVEAENHNSWLWFLKLLADDLALDGGLGWTLISDRQKGLLNVVATLLPSAEHRFCIRHMHNNFKQKFPGNSLKGKLWGAARAPNVELFTEYMEAIKNESVGAYDWLAAIPTHHWSRSHFTTENKCDILLNNMCESFNKCIIFARQQGILVMLELIREFLMRRLQSKREKCSHWELSVTPKAGGLVEKYKKWSGGCYSSYAGYNQFEVTTVSGHKFAVDLNKMTCGCRRWDLTGIPCHHAVAGMNRLQQDPYEFVDAAYSIKTYKAAYSGIIYPMNGEAQWLKTGHVVKPPTVQKQPGRPAKKRRRDANDDKCAGEGKTEGSKILRKTVQLTVRCSSCKQKGHNKRTCRDRHSTTEEQVFSQAGANLVTEDHVNNVQAEAHATELSDHQEHQLGTQDSVNSEWPVAPNPTLQEWPAWGRVETMPRTSTDSVPLRNIGKLPCMGGKGKGKSQELPPPVYIGPNLHGLNEEAPVKQYNTSVGGVTIPTAKFIKHGHFVVTTTALNKAREDAVLNMGGKHAAAAEGLAKKGPDDVEVVKESGLPTQSG